MLFITTELFIPQNSGGSVATFNYFKKYHTRDTILISFFDKNKYSEKHLAGAFKKEFKIKQLVLIPFDIRIRKKPFKMFQTVMIMLLKQHPYLAAKFYSRGMIRITKKIITEEAIDTIFIDHLNLAFIAPLIKKINPGTRLFLINHNNESEIIKNYAKTKKKSVFKIALLLEQKLIRRFQKNHHALFDKINCISDVDAKALNNSLGTDKFKYEPMPFYFDRKYQFKDNKKNMIGVCGSLSWPPNLQGIEWYLHHIHPSLLKEQKSYRFIIAGSGGDRALMEKWQAIEGVECIGFVKDLKDFYDRCKIVVVPLLSGSGIRIKILDAFSFSVPVVATSKAAQGLNISNGREALLSDDPINFIKNLKMLLDRPELGEKLSENAYNFLSTNHG